MHPLNSLVYTGRNRIELGGACAVEHADNRDAFGGGCDSGGVPDGHGQGVVTMRPRAAKQRAIDIEKDQGSGRQ